MNSAVRCNRNINPSLTASIIIIIIIVPSRLGQHRDSGSGLFRCQSANVRLVELLFIYFFSSSVHNYQNVKSFKINSKSNTKMFVFCTSSSFTRSTCQSKCSVFWCKYNFAFCHMQFNGQGHDIGRAF